MFFGVAHVFVMLATEAQGPVVLGRVVARNAWVACSIMVMRPLYAHNKSADRHRSIQ